MNILAHLLDARVQRWIFLLAAIVVTGFWIKSCDDNKKALKIAKQNIEALNGKVTEVKTKNGQLEYQKTMFIAELDELENLNKNLADELKKEKGNVKIIIEEQVSISYDTIYIDKVKHIQINNVTHKFLWKHYNYKPSLSLTIFGENTFDLFDNQVTNPTTTITNLTVGLEIIAGVKEIDGLYKVFVRTKEPNSNVKFKIDGAIVDKGLINSDIEEDRWHIGPYLGVGISSPLNGSEIYNSLNWQIGIGIGYSLYSF